MWPKKVIKSSLFTLLGILLLPASSWFRMHAQAPARDVCEAAGARAA